MVLLGITRPLPRAALISYPITYCLKTYVAAWLVFRGHHRCRGVDPAKLDEF
jgi:hypothetical protein